MGLRQHALSVCLGAAATVFALAPLFAEDTEFCLAGTVVNAQTGEPIRRAAVALLASSSITITDASGAFRICKLTAGDYIPSIEKPGFEPNGDQIHLGPSRENLMIRLQPLAVVRGKILDGDGEPVPNALVQALSTKVENGRRRAHVQAEAATDDRGEYRLTGLPGGRYYIRAAGWQGTPMTTAGATAGEETNEAFAPVYYGGTSELASASAAQVDPGSTFGADFTVTLQPAFQIRGKLAGFSAYSGAKIEVLRGEDSLGPAGVQFNAATGAFQIRNVASGSYVVRATQGEAEQRLFGEQPVNVNGADVNGVGIALAPGVVVRTMVHRPAAAASAPPAGSADQNAPQNQEKPDHACNIILSPTRAAPSPDDEFQGMISGAELEMAGVLPGHYRVFLNCGGGYISAAHVGDTDLLARNEMVVSPGVAPPPIDVYLGDDGGTVDASIESGGDPVADASVLLVPDSGNSLDLRLLEAPKGKCSFTAVAPGDYQVYAWRANEEFEFANPEARQTWSGRAARVHLDARGSQSVTVSLPAQGSQ